MQSKKSSSRRMCMTFILSMPTNRKGKVKRKVRVLSFFVKKISPSGSRVLNCRQSTKANCDVQKLKREVHQFHAIKGLLESVVYRSKVWCVKHLGNNPFTPKHTYKSTGLSCSKSR